MIAGPLLLYHLGLLVLPLAALALMRFRLTPALLLMAVLHHHPMEPMPSDQNPPPLCCALAQSVEADPEFLVVPVRRVRFLPASCPFFTPEPARLVKPAIRAPPLNIAISTPAPWVPVLRAA